MSKKKAPEEERIAEQRELSFDSTDGYEIIVEEYVNQRSPTGIDESYGIRNKRTGVIEMRWGAYSEALQGILVLQDSLDKYQAVFEKARGKLN